MSFPMGLGHDICHIPRIYKILTSKRGPRFVERVLTASERQKARPKAILGCVFACGTNADVNRAAFQTPQAVAVGNVPEARDPAFWKAAEYMAGRFAAKEAAIKAFHQHRLTFQNIQISSNAAVPRTFSKSDGESHGDQEPSREQQLSSGPPTAIVQLEGSSQSQSAMLSITHDGDYASAVCMYLPSRDQSPLK